MTQWLIEEAAFLSLEFAELPTVEPSDPEQASWEAHMRTMSR